MLKPMVFRGLTVGLLLLATVVHAAPVTFQFQGASAELQFPGPPLTQAEAQELSQKFAGGATLTLVYDAAAMVPSSGAFHYVSPSGPAFVLTVTNATGTSTFSFSEYRLFLDDQSTVDQVVLTPFLPADTTVTLSNGTAVQVDIGLILQDATGTSLTSASVPPATLDFSKLNFREYAFVFLRDDFTVNGRVNGFLVPAAQVVNTSTQIAFVVNEDGQPCSLPDTPCSDEIYVMDPDGTNQTRLTNNSARDYEPGFSSDGTKIVFVSTRDLNDEIYVMNVDGSDQTRLTSGGFANDLNPSFSPDGSKIAFTSSRDTNGEIYVMNADGSNPTNLTNDPWRDRLPSFSPDGTKIVFASNRDSGPTVGQEGPDEIYVMNADGSNPTRLTSNLQRNSQPSFSPDGSKIAFVSRRDGNFEIYVMNANGSGQTNLTNNPADDVSPAWSPDGSQIAFLSNRGGNLAIYVMNANGSGQTHLINNPASDITQLDDMIRIRRVSWGGPATFTPAGQDVQVSLADQTGATPVTLTFADVDQGGYTGLTTSTSGPEPPAGFKLGDPPTYYEITTTALFSDQVEVCISYNETDFVDESQLMLFHFEGGQWVDATDSGSLDTVNDIICGTVTSLSPFAIFEEAQATFQFSGFFPPVDNPPTVNVVKAGSAVPVKFSLNGDQGLDIFDVGYPKSQGITCDTTSPVDTLEETVTAGSSSLSYDASSDQYIYVWKTNKSWAAGSCRQLVVKLNDGTSHVAHFKFKK